MVCRFIQDHGLSLRYRENVSPKADRKGGSHRLQARAGAGPRRRSGPGEGLLPEKLDFVVDLDLGADNDEGTSGVGRVVQLTPPGSACSIAFGVGIVGTPPGSVQGLHLVVSDIRAARAELVGRGVDVGEVRDLGGVLYAPFSDPDGNGWTLQQLP